VPHANLRTKDIKTFAIQNLSHQKLRASFDVKKRDKCRGHRSYFKLASNAASF